jgi:hypothetical protein
LQMTDGLFSLASVSDLSVHCHTLHTEQTA